MKLYLRKLMSALCGAVLLLCPAEMAVPMSAIASDICGDVNDDGNVNNSDSIALYQYARGMRRGNSVSLKNSDVDRNMVLDINDQKILANRLLGSVSALPYSQTGQLYNNGTYNIPNDGMRYYRKYDCSTGTTTSYSLSLPAALSSVPDLPRSGSVDDRVLDSSDNAQCIVYLFFRTKSGEFGRGTGFIVDDGVIATCAHCLYDSSGFFTDYTIYVFNPAGTSYIATYTAKELHIPAQYYLHGYDDYDYGLIYVEDDLSDYGTMALGLPTNEFATAESATYSKPTLYVSGFPAFVNGSPTSNRYYSTGTVTSASNDYRIYCTAFVSDGDSGGPTYMEYTLNNETYRSAIGITTNKTDQGSYATRVTYPLLRFYYNNTHIG